MHFLDFSEPTNGWEATINAVVAVAGIVISVIIARAASKAGDRADRRAAEARIAAIERELAWRKCDQRRQLVGNAQHILYRILNAFGGRYDAEQFRTIHPDVDLTNRQLREYDPSIGWWFHNIAITYWFSADELLAAVEGSRRAFDAKVEAACDWLERWHKGELSTEQIEQAALEARSVYGAVQKRLDAERNQHGGRASGGDGSPA